MYSGPPERPPAGRNRRLPVELLGLVPKIRRSNGRKVVKLARALASLEQARVAPPPRKRLAKLSLP